MLHMFVLDTGDRPVLIEVVTPKATRGCGVIRPHHLPRAREGGAIISSTPVQVAQEGLIAAGEIGSHINTLEAATLQNVVDSMR